MEMSAPAGAGRCCPCHRHTLAGTAGVSEGTVSCNGKSKVIGACSILASGIILERGRLTAQSCEIFVSGMAF